SAVLPFPQNAPPFDRQPSPSTHEITVLRPASGHKTVRTRPCWCHWPRASLTIRPSNHVALSRRYRRGGVRRRHARPGTQPGRSRNILRDLIVEKLEIARTIGLVTDYTVSPVEPSRQLEACVTVRRSSGADDAVVKQYLANLLDGAVAVE